MKKFTFKRLVRITLFSVSILSNISTFATRNAPVTTAAIKSSCPAQTVVIPVTVTGFVSITALTLRIDYDPSVATYTSSVGNANLIGILANSVTVSPTLAKLLIVWSSVAPKTLLPTDTLMKITFSYISGSTTLVFNNTSNGGSDCEYADESGNAMNDLPTSTYYFNGAINASAVGPTGSVSGPSAVCAGANGINYSVAPVANATGYNWSVPLGFSVFAGSNTNSILVNVSGSASSGNISVTPYNSCGSGTASPNFAVTVNPLPVPTITGAGTACAGATVTYTTETGKTNYLWTSSPGGNITGGWGTSTITVTWITPGAQTVSVNYTNANLCTAATPTVKNITVNTLPTPTMTGPPAVCAGTAGNVYTTQAGMSNYAWTVSPGGTPTSGGTSVSNNVTVTWNTPGTQTVTVNYSNANGCQAASPFIYTVTVYPLPVPVITGPGAACTGAGGNVYSTTAGMTNYVWTVSPGGSISSGGSPTNSFVTVTWNTAGSQWVSLNYTNQNGCTANTPSVYNVAVSQYPVPTITGPNSICATTSGTYSTEGGMSNYFWNVSSGGTISSGQGTASVIVHWNSVGAQTLSVTYSTASGCSPLNPTVLNITVNPFPSAAGSITGASTVCAGTQNVAYSCSPIANTNFYIWTLPPGATIATGVGTNAITVNFYGTATSGDVFVQGNNLCGDGPLSPAFPVIVNPLPASAGTVSGSSSVCQGSVNVVYSVPAIPNALNYVWTVPAGANIVSGQNTNNILVNFGMTAQSGNISVYGTNACGNGTASPDFAVTVGAKPVTPAITLGLNTLASSAANGNQWYYSTDGIQGTPISGATSQQYTAQNNGFYWTVVTEAGCSSDTSNHKHVTQVGISETKNSLGELSVYPVPNGGIFTINLQTSITGEVDIEVINDLGITVHLEKNIPLTQDFKKTIDLRPVSPGVYAVILLNSQGKSVRRIIIL